MEVCRGDFESAADSEREAAVKVVEVDFRLRPRFPVDSVLQRVIPRQSVSDDRHVSGGQAVAECSPDVKFSEALAALD